MLLPHMPGRINELYALCGFFVGVIGVVPSVAVQAFPAEVRFSGLSFSYNVAYAVFGGLTPVAVRYLMESDPLRRVALRCGAMRVGIADRFVSMAAARDGAGMIFVRQCGPLSSGLAGGV